MDLEKVLRRCLLVWVIGMFSFVHSHAQSDLKKIIAPLEGIHSIQDHLDYIEDKLDNRSLSYASSRFDSGRKVLVESYALDIRSYFDVIFADYNTTFLEQDNKILIIVQGEKPVDYIRLYGYVKDASNGEVLTGAIIYDKLSGKQTFTNHEGYYNIIVRADQSLLVIEYLGYTPKIINSNQFEEKQLDIELDFENELSTVIISSQMPTHAEYWEGGEKVDVEGFENYNSLNGDNDLFDAVRRNVGAQSGNEGQGGFYVRGGSADQNLILLDGVAMYEVSHTAGLSSIFIDESIREAIFLKNGFSAEYGGRMSSVLDISLKEGNDQRIKGSGEFGLFGGELRLEGPIFKNKTTFNFSAKTSWINLFLNQWIREEGQYDAINIHYGDVTTKLTHKFTTNSKLSYSFYTGGDNIELEKSESFFDTESNPLVQNFRFRENNSLSWGSTVHALNYDQFFGDQWFWQVHLGKVSYNYQSKGFYEFISQNAGIPDTRILDVQTNSGIEDYSVSSNIDYYFNGDHRLKLGFNYIDHRYDPTLKQNDIDIRGESNVDTTSSRMYLAKELGLYIDDNILIKPWWRINSGIRLTSFVSDESNYLYVEPRFSSRFYLNQRYTFELSFSRMTQNTHLLVNPGIGLPSDLWVPSTNDIAPEISDQISLSFDANLPLGFTFYTAAYFKQLQNVLDYSASEDLFFTVLNDDKVTPIDLQTRGWEERVSSGNGESKGLEFSLARKEGRLQGWAAYTLSRTTRQFDDINEGQAYPYRFDRRHDINLGLSLEINSSFNISTNWVYGSGYAISLALEEISTPFEENILVPNGRNNLRMSPYHHLDVQFNYHHRSTIGDMDIRLGIYNIYNRFNQYYIYLFNNRLTGESSFRQVSLFPILPSLSLAYTFK